MKLLALAATAALALTAMPASAALLDIPVPANTYITFGGLDWVWASPCSPAGCSGGVLPLDLSYQATQGWRLPTAAEFAARPAPSDFSFAGANVPLGGADANGTVVTGSPPGDVACAVAYFTSASPFNWCDYGDGEIGAVFGNPDYANERNVETWLVRGDAVIPEPATWAMLIAGFGMVGFAARRRRNVAHASA
jgi:hypothetical protein